ncbi:unnamed protein product [Schistocephalus solidus]|uniref:Ubiquitin-like domain-containing protein n=1 Tax=Schistocephalus solidus TaxID=70667 RepID=A0A183THT9_SCHSO|nr:unnamed protein product [Schistocephalus solidus]
MVTIKLGEDSLPQQKVSIWAAGVTPVGHLWDSMTLDQLTKAIGEHVEVDEADGDNDEGEQVDGGGDEDEEEAVLFGDPAFLTHCRSSAAEPLSEVSQIESTYANFHDFLERTTGLDSEFSTSSKPESNSCDTQDGQTPELSEILGGAPLEWTYFVSSADAVIRLLFILLT